MLWEIRFQFNLTFYKKYWLFQNYKKHFKYILGLVRDASPCCEETRFKCNSYSFRKYLLFQNLIKILQIHTRRAQVAFPCCGQKYKKTNLKLTFILKLNQKVLKTRLWIVQTYIKNHKKKYTKTVLLPPNCSSSS